MPLTKATPNVLTPISSLVEPNSIVQRDANGIFNVRSIGFDSSNLGLERIDYQNKPSQLSSIYVDLTTVTPQLLSGFYSSTVSQDYVIELNTGYSLTSRSIGTGSRSFTTQSGLSAYFPVGSAVSVRYNDDNDMTGTVTSYNNTTGALVCDIVATSGSGTFAQWSIICEKPDDLTDVLFQSDGIWLDFLSGAGIDQWYELSQPANTVGFNVFTTATTSGTCRFGYIPLDTPFPFQTDYFKISSLTFNTAIVGMYCINQFHDYVLFPPFNPLVRAIGSSTTNLITNIVENDVDLLPQNCTPVRITNTSGTATSPNKIWFSAESGLGY